MKADSFRRWSLAAALFGWAAPAAAQTPAPAADPATVYRREVFQYQRGSRPDPFRSLLASVDLGVRLEDLSLRGVMYHPDPARSVAVLVRQGDARPMRVRVGQRIGGVRVIAIRPNSVDLVVEELGVARRATLEIRRTATTPGSVPEKGGSE